MEEKINDNNVSITSQSNKEDRRENVVSIFQYHDEIDYRTKISNKGKNNSKDDEVILKSNNKNKNKFHNQENDYRF